MTEVKISEIEKQAPIKHDFYHDSGRQIFYRKEYIDEYKIDELERLEIKSLQKIKNNTELQKFLKQAKIKEIKLTSRMEGKRIATNLFDKNEKVLIGKGMKVSSAHIDACQQLKMVYFRKKTEAELDEKVVDEYFKKVEEMQAAKGSMGGVGSISKKVYNFSNSEVFNVSGRKGNQVLDQLIEKNKEGFKLDANGNRLLQNKVSEFAERTEEYKDGYKLTYLDLLDEVKELLASFKKPGTVQLPSVVRFSSRIVNTIVSDMDLVTNFTNNQDYSSKDYLASHTLNVTLHCINIGCAMEIPESLIFELAMGALLADVGMLFVPDEIINKPGKLTNIERKLIKNHPSMGLDLIEGLSGLPVNIPYVIYQSHERPDGSGYPRGRPDHLIHDFAKIIAIADIFDALCSDRPWRKGLIPYKAMEKMLVMAKRRYIDLEIFKKWLTKMSLFPIGSWISLNDSSVSRVISANPDNILRPFLRVVYEEGDHELDKYLNLNLSENSELKITHALHPSEVNGDLMKGF